MDKAPQKLFVYSSLRSGFQHPAYAYISKYFTLEGEALVKGKLYDLGNQIVGIPTQENEFVKGELYTIKEPTEFSWALAQLDDYEGIMNHEENVLPLYIRALNTVYINGIEVKAWIYWFNRTVQDGKLIESGDILAYLQAKK